jgi:hypothetical protein
MSYGPDVKVLEPQALREKLKELYRRGDWKGMGSKNRIEGLICHIGIMFN